MNRFRAALFAALLLPLTGCVFAVGSDDEGTEALRDRVRDLEKRVDRMERPTIRWESGVDSRYIIQDGKAIQEVPAPVEPAKDPK
jgi:hypothetical protein